MLTKLCFVTSNTHKFLEAGLVARSMGIELEMCSNLKLELQGDNLEEIAMKSAMIAYTMLSRPVLVEDAGLFVEALNGFPGPYSSYVYKTIGIRGLLKLLEGVENRAAYFKSAAAIAFERGVLLATGEVRGTISTEPRGDLGFGFDPVFVPLGETRTFAEMTIEEKNLRSHRAQAVRKVLEAYVKKLVEPR